MNMTSFEGKRILALIRDGDYAHAGEEEGIERSFRSIPKNADSWLLDVGCGGERDGENSQNGAAQISAHIALD